MTQRTTFEGWQLVPVEPTEEMKRRGHAAIHDRNGTHESADCYRAMLSAAPRTEPCGGSEEEIARCFYDAVQKRLVELEVNTKEQAIPWDEDSELGKLGRDCFTAGARAIRSLSPLPQQQEGGWHRAIEAAAKKAQGIVKKFHGPRCRDCADEDGICPSSGLPCDPAEWPEFVADTIRVLKKDAADHSTTRRSELPSENK